jgi:hypothetical protein
MVGKLYCDGDDQSESRRKIKKLCETLQGPREETITAWLEKVSTYAPVQKPQLQ